MVVGTDSVATFGTGLQPTIGQQPIQKLMRLNEHIIYCATGAVGISQIIADRIRSLWDSKAFSGTTSPDAAMDRVGKEITQLVGPYLQTGQFQRSLTGDASTSLCKSLVAMPIAKKPYLFQFDCNGAPERCTSDIRFVALGSGQLIADPFLAFLGRLLWSSREPTLSEGRLAAVWTIDHVRRTHPGGVGGDIQLACLELVPGEMPRIRNESQEDVQEHLQKVSFAEQVLVQELTGEDSGQAATLPLPPDNTPP